MNETDYSNQIPYGGTKGRTVFNIDDIIQEITGGTVREAIDDVMKVSNLGPISNALTNHFYGINHAQLAPLIPHNNDHIGLTFFTKPTLNLSDNVLVGNRHLAGLLTGNQHSIQRTVRCILDPKIARDTKRYPCVLNDHLQAFIPLLSNSLLTMSGMQSIALRTYTSPTGRMGEELSMVDDWPLNYRSYDIQASFKNTQGNPLLLLFLTWIYWSAFSYVSPHYAVRYTEDILANRIVYTTRPYRLLMDQNKKHVTGIWAPHYAFPINLETGNIFAFDYEKPLNLAAKQMDVTFRCVGNIINDDLLIEQFNQTVWMMNPNMHDQVRNSVMIKVPMYLMKIFNHNGYPRINPKNYELEWYVTKEKYESERVAIRFIEETEVTHTGNLVPNDRV